MNLTFACPAKACPPAMGRLPSCVEDLLWRKGRRGRKLWHLTLNVEDFRLSPLMGANQGQMLWVWVHYLSITTVANLPVIPSAL